MNMFTALINTIAIITVITNYDEFFNGNENWRVFKQLNFPFIGVNEKWWFLQI